MPELLQVQDLRKEIDENVLVDDISFTVEALQKIAIAGESGAGKTTLLKMISGYTQPTSGNIFFYEERVEGPDEKLLPGHKSIGYLSQNYELRNNYRVEELIWFENKLSEEEATTLFEICRISHLLQRRTDKLSGGEKQRISLCMLLVQKPKLLVLDEPFSNLDPIHTEILKGVLADITERLQITCLLASHDPHDTLSWADKIIVIRQGKVIQTGTPQEIYYDPINEYVAGMFGRYNVLSPEVAKWFDVESKGTNIIVRPEKFEMNTTGNGIKGTIEKISFWGSFYEVKMLVNKTKIFVRMITNEWKIGQEVFVTMNKD